MLKVSDLTVRAGGRTILDRVSFTLEEGLVYVLLGENGSGKTTLMRALTSGIAGYSGSIRWNGCELSGMSGKQREAFHSLLPQNPPAVAVSVTSLLSLYDGGPGELDRLGLASLAEMRVSALSGGERQLVYLALMLSQKAQLCCLDEAQSSLDARHRRIVDEEIRAISDSGRMVLASFHDIAHGLELADRILVLSGGKLVFSGTADLFISQEIPQRFFSLEPVHFTDGEGRDHLAFI